MTPRARPEVLALLAETKDRPEEDTPRLVLADFLEDSPLAADRARGEFLRLHCQLARLADTDPERTLVTSRAGQMLAEHEADWLGPLLAGDVVHNWRWRGAFVWIEVQGGRLLSREANALEGSETLAWVEGVRFGSQRRPTLLARSLVSPLLEDITGLELSGTSLQEGDLEALAQSCRMRQIRSLDLSGNSETKSHQLSQGLALLGQSDNLGSLTFLALRGLWSPPENFAELASGPGLAALEEIDFSESSFGPAGLLALARSPSLERLRTVRQRKDGIWLHACSSCHTWYDDDSSHLSQAPWLELMQTPGLQRWRRLDLADNRDADGHLVDLANSPHVGNLTHLDLSGWDRINTAECGALVRSVTLTSLVELNLTGTPLPPGQRERFQDRFGAAVRFGSPT